MHELLVVVVCDLAVKLHEVGEVLLLARRDGLKVVLKFSCSHFFRFEGLLSQE